MRNETPEPLLNARFRVEVEGLKTTGAVEVTLPWGRIVLEHGSARNVEYGPLVLRRGFSRASEWYRWWNSARASSVAAAKRVTVVLLDQSEEEAVRWTFSRATPIAYAVSPLNALGTEPVFETLELTLDGFTADFASTSIESGPTRPAGRRSRAKLR